MGHLVFVYGTLKKGFPNHDQYMGSAQLLGQYHTVEKYPLVLCGERYVPCMIHSPGQGYHVEGELFEVGDECLKRMDALERTQEPDGYRRHAIPVRSSEEINQDMKEALAYLVPPENVTDRLSQNLRAYSAQVAKKYRHR